MRYILFALVALFCLQQVAVAGQAGGGTASSAGVNAPIPQPAGVGVKLSPSDPPEQVLGAFLGIPYRPDGVIDNDGRYTLFAHRDDIQATPGLNCSGYVIAVCRYLFNKNLTLAEVGVDRLGDSGPDSPYGEDWDLGLDLILNISEGLPRRFLLPGNQTLAAEKATGFSPRGFELQAPETWKELPQRLKPGRIYLLSFNKDVSKPGYKAQHYHVGIFYVDEAGVLWFYNTTTGAKKSYRRNLSDKDSLAVFLKSFADTGKVRKRIMVLEVERE